MSHLQSSKNMPMELPLPGFNMRSKLDSQQATILIGWYTFLLHFAAAFYFMGLIRGESSTWAPSPLFEYGGSAQITLASIMAIYCFVYMLLASLGLIRGVKTETRIYYFPWLFITAIEIVLLFWQVLFIITRYSYDANIKIWAVVILIFALYHSYLYLIVLSNYRYLKRIQNPTLIFPPEL